jgi:hypothetical protein
VATLGVEAPQFTTAPRGIRCVHVLGVGPRTQSPAERWPAARLHESISGGLYLLCWTDSRETWHLRYDPEALLKPQLRVRLTGSMPSPAWEPDVEWRPQPTPLRFEEEEQFIEE